MATEPEGNEKTERDTEDKHERVVNTGEAWALGFCYVEEREPCNKVRHPLQVQVGCRHRSRYYFEAAVARLRTKMLAQPMKTVVSIQVDLLIKE